MRRMTGGDDRRGGFTLIECIVVAFVLLLCLAIAAPAVMRIRERARKASCADNLHRIGLGLASYASAFGTLPPATGPRGASLHVAILPHLGATAAHNAINAEISLDAISEEHFTALQAAPDAFLCPSDSSESEVGGREWTNYAGNRGVGVQRYGENGAFRFPHGRVVGYRDFADGTSNTSMASEWTLDGGRHDPRDPHLGIFHTPKSLDRPEQFAQFIDACDSLSPITGARSNKQKGVNWMHGEFCRTLYNHTMPINRKSCLNGSGYQVGAWTAGSRHPGGVHTLLADGSARFVGQSIALPLWHAIGSRNGGETLPDGGF